MFATKEVCTMKAGRVGSGNLENVIGFLCYDRAAIN
jgi:hypothetical protein